MVAEYISQSRADARDYKRCFVWFCEETGLPTRAPRERRLERAKGFEPSTPTLARSCSTPELHPHPVVWPARAGRQGRSYSHNRPGLATTLCPERSMLSAMPSRFRPPIAGVRVTEAAGAGEDERHAGFQRRISAIPARVVHCPGIDRAPRGLWPRRAEELRPVRR